MPSWKVDEKPRRAEAPSPEPAGSIEDLSREIARLHKLLRKHGHAQEMFQGRVERRIERLADRDGDARDGLRPAQLRTLIELDQAIRHLLELARGHDGAGGEDQPRSVREGLDMLHIRVGNLQRSFGLEAIPARGQPFDDRVHRAHQLCHRDDLADGQVVEEVLPGYRLAGKVVRPALVIVNRRPGAARRDGDE